MKTMRRKKMQEDRKRGKDELNINLIKYSDLFKHLCTINTLVSMAASYKFCHRFPSEYSVFIAKE